MKVINKKIIIIMISIFISFYCDENSDRNNVNGCTDSIATNYSNLATNDDGSCEYTLNGVTLKWLRTFNSSDGIYFNEGWSVEPTSDGGFIIAGAASGYVGLLIKTDSNGQKEWHQVYNNSTSLHSASQTSDGGFIATGYYECDTSAACYPDIFLVKTNSNGAIEWEQLFGNEENNDWGRSVIETQDGNYVLTGTWNDDGWNSKALLRKYSNTGSLIWSKTFSSSDANEGYSVIETSDGNLVFAGYSGTQHGAYNNFMVKTNADGGQLWKKKNQSVGDALLYSVVESPSGGYAAAGFCNSWRANSIIKKNQSGGTQWQNCYVEEGSNYGYYDITASSRGGYYLIDERSFLTKIDDEGTIIFSIQLYQVNQSIIELEDGDIVVGGYGFREGNDGGAISLIRLDPSQFE